MSLLELNSDRKGGGVFFFFNVLYNKNYSLCYTKLVTLFCNAYADSRQNVN